MSSNFCLATLCCAAFGAAIGAPPVAATPLRFADVVMVPGDQLTGVVGQAIDRLTVLACTATECHPIPFQIDERDAAGQWVLDRGPRPTRDDPPGMFDANDLLLFMAGDAGEPAAGAAVPEGAPRAAIVLHDPLDGTTHCAYLVAFADRAPRAAREDLAYDAATDRVRGRLVGLGFANGVPDYLALGDGANLLDRLKVRAAATFLFGLIHFSRSEADLSTEFMGWHAGPIRMIRGQRQWVRLGWGVHSPTFGSYTYFYPDFAELPVGLHLNFKPTHFFGNILVQAVLDFRDLRGWSLVVPSVPEPIPIDGVMTPQKVGLERLTDTWFALRGPRVTLVESMALSPSLASLRPRLVYHETTQPMPPESVPGEAPGIGYQLDHWEGVGAGAHQLASVSYALPLDVDVRAFMRTRGVPLQVHVVPYNR